MNPEYETFELLIGTANGVGYPVTVVESPAGEATGLLLLDPQDGELEDALALIENRDLDAGMLAEIGSFLFEELFSGGVGSLYRSSLAMVRDRQSRLRLRLRLEASELAVLPWEFLHDPEEDRFPAVSSGTALLRFIPLRLPARPTAIKQPLRVLVVISDPVDVVRLDVEQERRIVADALKESVETGLVELHFLERAVIADINQAMRTIQPHVFHFVGHGHFDGDRAAVVLEDENGNANYVDETIFREFFAGSKETRLAFLNACQSATTSSSRPLAGLAPNLLQRNLSAVIAMQYPITDAAALTFSREFYRSLATGRPVDVAVSEARKGVYMELGADQPDWGIPVLFLRAKDGQLFDVEEPEQPAQSAVAIPPPPEPAKPPAVERFVGREADLSRYQNDLKAHNIAVVTGMPGIGKTGVASVLAQRVAPPEKLFWHSFHSGEGVESILWKLAGFLAWNGQSALWEMLQGISLSGGDIPPTEVLLDYYLQVVKGQNYLLVLDNVQLVIDDPVLEQLAARIRGAVQHDEVRLVLVSQRIPDFVQSVDVSPLSGLTLDETQLLFESLSFDLPPEVTAELQRRTGGNVQLLKLTANACNAMGSEQLTARLLESQDVERFLLSEVDQRLNEGEKEVMSGLAVLLGFPGTRDAIEEVLDGKNVRRQLMELVYGYLLEVVDGASERAYSQHSIVQAFYYDLLSRRERNALHSRAAAWYEFEEMDDWRAALHYQHARNFEKSADIATRDVWTFINLGHARPLLALLNGLEERRLAQNPLLWIKVLLARGIVYGYLEEADAARAAYGSALALLASDTSSPEAPRLRARAHRGMAYTLRMQSAAQALAWVEMGLAEIGEEDSAQRADLLIQRAISQRFTGDTSAAEASLQQALEILPSGADYERMLALLNLGYIHFLSGHQTQAIAAAEEALALAQRTHNAPNELIITSNLAAFHQVAGDWQKAAAGYAAAVELARQMGNNGELVRVEVNRGVLALYQGNLPTARRALEFTLADAREHDVPQTIVTSLLYLCKVCLAEGTPELAAPLLAEAESLAAESQMLYQLPMIYELSAHLLLAEGEADDVDDAEAFVQRSIGEAQKQKMSSEEGIGLRVLGQIHAQRGENDGALTLFERSLARLVEDPYETAQTQLAWGQLLTATGAGDAGRERIDAAAETFARLGVKGEVEEFR